MELLILNREQKREWTLPCTPQKSLRFASEPGKKYRLSEFRTDIFATFTELHNLTYTLKCRGVSEATDWCVSVMTG